MGLEPHILRVLRKTTMIPHKFKLPKYSRFFVSKLPMKTNHSASFQVCDMIVKRIHGLIPAGVIELRRAVYRDETGFLSEENLLSENDNQGVHICLIDTKTGLIMGAAHVLKAEESDFSKYADVPKSSLNSYVYGSRHLIHPDFRRKGLFTLLLYLTMREGRMLGRTSLIAYQNLGDVAVNRVIQMKKMTHLENRKVQGCDGLEYEVVPCGQDISYGMYLAWEKMTPELKNFAAEHLFAEEVEMTVASRLDTFYDNPWFNAVAARSLTKNQYIEMLGDWHNFVRWTTRLLARVVGITDNKELRSSYISHLNGEIDHEIMIESDVKHLGGDVTYIKQFMAPGKPIQLFMGLQESLASFRQDPVLFLAVPYSIEGISANISAEIIRNLVECIKSWGVENPRRACSFLSSHVHTDGGDDGHWEHSLHMIKKFLRSEPELQKFLVISHLVFDTIGASFSHAVSKMDYQELRPLMSKNSNHFPLGTNVSSLDASRVAHV